MNVLRGFGCLLPALQHNGIGRAFVYADAAADAEVRIDFYNFMPLVCRFFGHLHLNRIHRTALDAETACPACFRRADLEFVIGRIHGPVKVQVVIGPEYGTICGITIAQRVRIILVVT